MLDINKIRENKKAVEKALLKRMDAKDLDLDKLIKLDDKRKDLTTKVDELKAERNKHSKTKPTPEVISKMKKLGADIKKLDQQVDKVTQDFNPGITAPFFSREVPPGTIERADGSGLGWNRFLPS